MASNSVENLKRIAKYLKVPPGTIAINNEKVNKNVFSCFFFSSALEHNLNQVQKNNN